VLGALLTTVSCSDDVLNVTNTNVPNEDVFEGSIILQQGAVNGIYKPMQSQGSYSRWQYLLEDLTSDEIVLSINQPAIQRIVDYNLDNDTEANTNYWNSCFAGVRAANDVINSYSEINESNIRFVAEARFLRGHYFFLLASQFGGLPINLSSEPTPTPRSTFAETFEVIIEDFTFAAENLPSRAEQDLGRPNTETAFAYLGKAHLFSIEPLNFGNSPEAYDSAFDAFDQVTSYSLSAEYTDNFNEGGEYNNESLFEIDFRRQNAGETEIWSANLPDGISDVTFRSVEYSSWGNSLPRQSLLDEYEEKSPGVIDPRQGDTFWFRGDSYGASGRIWGTDADANRGDFGNPAAGNTCSRKFSEYIEYDGSLEGSGINFRIIRYADVLLMKAEAALFKSSPDMGLAISLMNQVRSRASVQMPGYPIPGLFPCSNINETFDALVHERKIELALEGKRKLDLGRWRRDQEILSPIKPGYNTNRRFFPIPNSELLTNPVFGEDNPQ